LNARFSWTSVCEVTDILPDMGVCAEIAGRQVALFRIENAVYALDNFDPASGANVLSRGIVGDLGGETVVASPLYKHHYSLSTGRCLEEPDYSLEIFPARVVEGRVWVRCAEPGSSRASAKRRLVVVGNGMAGMRTVEELLKMAPEIYDIEVFGAEPHGNYNRIMLSPVLAGEKQVDEIMLHPLAWYGAHGVTLHSGDPVVTIDRRRRCVTSRNGVVAFYDRLLLATGSRPMVVPVPGSTLPGVVTFRDLHDVDTMLQAARAHRHAIVIGGGLLGLEAANGLRSRGMNVTVVHLHPRLMERQLDATAAELLQASLEKRGLHFKMSTRTDAIDGDSRVTGVRFRDGTELPADLVVMAVGIKPNIALAQSAALRCERGILVDDTLLTYDPSIYAVGECVQHRNSTYGLVAPLWEQARVCAAHLAEIGLSRYSGSLLSTQLKVAGINLFSAGNLQETARSESLIFNDVRRGVYKRLIIEDDKVRGAVLYGDTADGAWYLDMMADGRSIGGLRNKLLFGAVFATPQ
jgi:NAD(P)H-dependent nitrite reductase large subunit/NAD(P)H-dependent nitrite reductase small subunit